MIVVIDKPSGPTSHDMIYRVRKVTHEKRVGHAGTLDPMASGVLVVAISRESTKKLTQIMNHDKEYEAIITLGAISDTDDALGNLSSIARIDDNQIDFEESVIQATLKQFEGEIVQVPPIYSAIKKDGKKAYELARKGKAPIMEARKVIVYKIELDSYDWPDVKIKVHCDKGVYIRALARDIGQALGVGGYLSYLRRTRVGDYKVENALSLDQVAKKWEVTKKSLNV